MNLSSRESGFSDEMPDPLPGLLEGVGAPKSLEGRLNDLVPGLDVFLVCGRYLLPTTQFAYMGVSHCVTVGNEKGIQLVEAEGQPRGAGIAQVFAKMLVSWQVNAVFEPHASRHAMPEHPVHGVLGAVTSRTSDSATHPWHIKIKGTSYTKPRPTTRGLWDDSRDEDGAFRADRAVMALEDLGPVLTAFTLMMGMDSPTAEDPAHPETDIFVERMMREVDKRMTSWSLAKDGTSGGGTSY